MAPTPMYVTLLALPDSGGALKPGHLIFCMISRAHSYVGQSLK